MITLKHGEQSSKFYSVFDGFVFALLCIRSNFILNLLCDIAIKTEHCSKILIGFILHSVRYFYCRVDILVFAEYCFGGSRLKYSQIPAVARFVGPIFLAISSCAATFNYSYDPLNRLTNTAYSDGSREVYSHDPAGNRLSRIILTATNKVDITPPSTPTNLVSLIATPGQLTIGWNRAFDTGGSGLAGYLVDVNGAVTNTVGTNFTLTGLAPDTEYCFTIAAYDRSKNLSGLSATFCLVTAHIPSSPNASAEMKIFPSPIPNGPVSLLAYLVADVNFLKTGQGLSADRSVPANMIVTEHFDFGDLLVSTNNSLWRGQTNPPAPFNNEKGVYFSFGLAITSAVPFNLNGLFSEYRGSDPSNSISLTGPVVSNYGFGINGLWYGPDGIRGTPDDVTRTFGPGNQLINELYCYGAATAYVVNNQNQINFVKSLLAANDPYTITCHYTLYNTNGVFLTSAFRTASTATNRPPKIICLLSENGSLNFGSVAAGATKSLSLTVSNAGPNAMTVSGVGCPYGFNSSWSSAFLPPGRSTNVTINFHPDLSISYGGFVTVYSDATAGTDVVPMTGAVTSIPTTNTINVAIYPSPGPNTTSPSYAAYRNNLIRFLETGFGAALDRSKPENFITPSIVEAGDILQNTNSFSLWRGQLNPLAPFNNEKGGFVYFTVRVVSATQFNANGVSWYHRDSANSMTPYSGQLTGFSDNIVGLSFGSDRIRGTADDVWITSGSGTQLVNELYFSGIGWSFFGNSQSQITNVINNIVATNSPYYVICTWNVAGTNGGLLGTSTKSVLVIQSLPIPSPTLTSARFTQLGQFFARVNGTPGIIYEIWTSTNLFDWQYQMDLTATNASTPWMDQNTNKYSERFYRFQIKTNNIVSP